MRHHLLHKNCVYAMHKRNAVDTFWPMDTRVFKDGMFNFIVWSLGMIIPVIVAFKAVPGKELFRVIQLVFLHGLKESAKYFESV
jgi:hypothetical protein